MLIRKLWRSLGCRRRGHDWYHYTDYGRFYKEFPSIAIKHRVCQHCGKAQVGVPVQERPGSDIGCLWVAESVAMRAMSDPTYYTAIGDEQGGRNV